MKRITIWERKFWKKNNGDKVLVIEHNHIEDGWNARQKPVPNCKFQKRAWKNAIWIRKYGYLNDNNKVVENGK